MTCQSEDRTCHPTLLTVADVADDGQISEKTVRRWIKQGFLPAVHLGRNLRITRQDWQTFITEHKK